MTYREYRGVKYEISEKLIKEVKELHNLDIIAEIEAAIDMVLADQEPKEKT